MAPANPTYIVGHRNPDADSICSAIAYAAFKEARGEAGYVAARCGNSNARIDAILDRFSTPLPVYLSDVYPRVRDLMVPQPLAVTVDATCAEALNVIDRHGVTYLPVVDDAQRAVGSLTLAQLGHFFIPRLDEPRALRQVRTSLARTARSLRGSVFHTPDETRPEDLYVRIGSAFAATFWKISENEKFPGTQSRHIVGDRR